MSPPLIARSPDLQRLRDQGYTLRLQDGWLVVEDVPYVDAQRLVHRDGAVVMALTLAGEQTAQPNDHTAYFVGAVPCAADGVPLNSIINNTNRKDLGGGLIASCYFSAKPTTNNGRYQDFHHKVATYVGHISGPAASFDASATARRYRPIRADEGTDHPFKYLDTASSRAGISALSHRLDTERLGIVGLGGTGGYILDLVAKTPVEDIHAFDRDLFLTHNAFRGPGAPALDILDTQPLKVDYFSGIYSNMHRGIVAHPYDIDSGNVGELAELTFVFLAIDDAFAKEPIIDALIEFRIPFIDVGMGVHVVDEQLVGLIRTTMVTPEKHDHAHRRIATLSTGVEDEYRSNIQVAELNAINASFAVILWKQYRRVYARTDPFHSSIYNPVSNKIVNDEESADEPEARNDEA